MEDKTCRRIVPETLCGGRIPDWITGEKLPIGGVRDPVL